MNMMTLLKVACKRPVMFESPTRFVSRKAKRERKLAARRERLLAKQANPWVPRQEILKKKQFQQLAKERLIKMQEAHSQNLPSLIPHQPTDDVWMCNMYAPHKYTIREALEMQLELNDVTMYNKLNNFVQLKLDLNMQIAKSNKFLDNIKGMVRIPHFFDEGENRIVLALSEDPASLEKARDAGAEITGGIRLVEQIETGELTAKEDFQVIVCTPEILPRLLPLKKHIKTIMPSPKLGNVGMDLAAMTDKFLFGKYYTILHPLEEEHAWGQSEFTIGSLDMSIQHLEKNAACFIEAILSHKPKKMGSFINEAIVTVEDGCEDIHVVHEL